MSNIEENKEKKTLVYFASGHYKESYEYLPYDQIFLVDYCFANRNNTEIEISKSRKVICLGMDCLLSIDYLKHLGVKIDCYVVLNEGMYEGNGRIALNSDLVLGLIAPILKNDYVHIMNQNYYGHCYRVTMDLPFEKSEIHPGEPDYLDPFLFSSDSYHKGHAKVYRMKKKQISALELKLNPDIKISIVHDSIWCYAEELDLLAISFTPQGQGDYFNRINKVYSLRENSIADVLEHCVQNKLEKIGITPWGQGNYKEFIDLIRSYKKEYPKEISLFHLNFNDFNSLRDLV
jgi:hypothetical protein